MRKKKGKMGKLVSGKKYAAVAENEDDVEQAKDNFPSRKPNDIAQALKRAKKTMGYSKKPRIKPQKKKGVKGR
jgi:hypothetical protein